jgi:hypothetical protein
LRRRSEGKKERKRERKRHSIATAEKRLGGDAAEPRVFCLRQVNLVRPALSVPLDGDESRRIIPAENNRNRELRFVLDAYCGWGIEAYILLQNDWSLPIFPRNRLTEAGLISWVRGDIGMCK